MACPSNCSLLRLLAVLCIVLYGMGKTTVALSSSCEVTRSTVQFVDHCPDSEEKWRKAAARKQCDITANQCSEPERLVYHCVINTYVNQTLEVCAYTQNIVLGHCTTYSIYGNMVQRNLETNCTNFKEKPCPIVYPSNESYKYPGCYQLIKKLTTVKYNIMSSRNPDTTVAFTTPSSNVSSNKNEDMDGKEETTDVLPIILGVILVLVILCITACLYVWTQKRQKSNQKNLQEGVLSSLTEHR